MILIGLPTTSSAVQPKMRWVPLFQDWMMPSRFLLTMTSSDDSTIAASLAWASRSGPMPF
jgi:hypothetical protein